MLSQASTIYFPMSNPEGEEEANPTVGCNLPPFEGFAVLIRSCSAKQPTLGQSVSGDMMTAFKISR